MRTEQAGWRALLQRQEQVVTAAQAARHGFSPSAVAAQVAARRWQRAAPSVYATFTGPLPESSRQWAALLYAGPGAVLSHETAARCWGLRVHEGVQPVDVLVGNSRKVRARAGLRVHRSRVLATSACYDVTPPRTSVEATVFDLPERPGDALALVTRAVQLKLTTADRLLAELGRRRTQRWRALLREALSEAAAGAHSLLELRYLRDVEIAHGLPAGLRQRRAGATLQDVFYEGFQLVVELDGRLGHADADGAWRDMARDNASALRSETTLRYGWDDVTGRPCEVARQIAGLLLARGWSGPAAPSNCGNCHGL